MDKTPEKRTPEKRVFRPGEAARYIGVSRTCLLNWEKSGMFPPAITIGPGVRGWTREMLDQYIDSRPLAPIPTRPRRGTEQPASVEA